MLRPSKVFLTVLVASSLTSTFANAGKPPKNPPPPPPPQPVTYRLQVYDMPTSESGYINVNSYKMASDGKVVGSFTQNGVTSPFLYDAASDQAFNLNDIGVSGIPSGWRIAAALGINNYGFVVGGIEEVGNPGVLRGFILDIEANPPLLTTLPDGPGHTYPRGINDDMDIVGVRLAANGNYRGYVFNPLFDSVITELGFDLATNKVEISNPLPGFPAQVVGWRASDYSIFRYKIDTGVTSLLFRTSPDNREAPQDISSIGVVCGGYPKPRTKNGFTAFRYGGSLEVLSNVGSASAINAHGDLATWSDRTLYHEATGLINLDSTLIGDPSDLNTWNNSYDVLITDLTERGAVNPLVPDFPAICGWIWANSNGSKGFVLVPVTH